MEWPVLFGGAGLVITVATILVGLGATLQRLKEVDKTLGELKSELRNGLLRRLNDHSGEIDVLRTEAHAMRDALAATERNIERSCQIRHGLKAGAR